MQAESTPGAQSQGPASNPTATDANDPALLWQRWQALRDSRSGLRARDGAEELGVSEAELVNSNPASRRLHARWGDIIEGLRAVGPIMALTRNHGVVIEKTGPVEAVDIYPAHSMGQVVGTDVDLRLFLRHWHFGFAVSETGRSGQRDSLQFFDAQGVAVHKVYRTGKTDANAWAGLVTAQTDNAPQPMRITPPEPAPRVLPDTEIDADGLREGWLGMSNTHDFFGLLRKFGVERRQALRLAGADLARPVAANAYRAVLETARNTGDALMLFVGNHGCLQVHTGPVRRLETVGQWFNVMDPGFNLHLWQPAISTAWLVRKPTDRGVFTSLECYDDAGELLLQCFGKRKGDASESSAWRELLTAATGEADFIGANP